MKPHSNRGGMLKCKYRRMFIIRASVSLWLHYVISEVGAQEVTKRQTMKSANINDFHNQRYLNDSISIILDSYWTIDKFK